MRQEKLQAQIVPLILLLLDAVMVLGSGLLMQYLKQQESHHGPEHYREPVTKKVLLQTAGNQTREWLHIDARGETSLILVGLKLDACISFEGSTSTSQKGEDCASSVAETIKVTEQALLMSAPPTCNLMLPPPRCICVKQVDKHSLVSELGVPYRDLSKHSCF